MVLFAIIGELGAGKTLTATMLTFKNWFYRRKIVACNYHLFKIPYIFINSIQNLSDLNCYRCKSCLHSWISFEKPKKTAFGVEIYPDCEKCKTNKSVIKSGIITVDELWTIADSRLSRSKMNTFTANILARSRKKGADYFFTSQILEQLDKRIKKVIDFTGIPMLSADESFCRIFVFRNTSMKVPIKEIRFLTKEIMTLYDTNEIVDMDEESEYQPPIVFQESRDSEPIFFNDWMSADAYAEKYWEKRMKELKVLF